MACLFPRADLGCKSGWRKAADRKYPLFCHGIELPLSHRIKGEKTLKLTYLLFIKLITKKMTTDHLF